MTVLRVRGLDGWTVNKKKRTEDGWRKTVRDSKRKRMEAYVLLPELTKVDSEENVCYNVLKEVIL